MSYSPVPSELHLRRLHVEEAVSRLDKYLDQAFMAELLMVRIVHGKGSGAVRNAVWQHLEAHPLVKSFQLADYGQGDYGVTVVELERLSSTPCSKP